MSVLPNSDSAVVIRDAKLELGAVNEPLIVTELNVLIVDALAPSEPLIDTIVSLVKALVSTVALSGTSILVAPNIAP